MLVGAVVIHGPDFFVPRSAANIIDLRFRNAVNAAAQAEDDFIGKLMGDDPCGLRAGRIRILLA